jgi:hypothetical protein
MRQRAIQAGCVSNPYRFIEAGQEFDHPEPLKWAIPVGSLEPGASTEVIDAPRRGRKKAAPGDGDESVI